MLELFRFQSQVILKNTLQKKNVEKNPKCDRDRIKTNKKGGKREYKGEKRNRKKMSKQKKEIKVQIEYGKSRCDVKKKQFLRPQCKIVVKNLHMHNAHTEYEKICLFNLGNID